MADLYPPSTYHPPRQQQPYSRHQDTQQHPQFNQIGSNGIVYSQQIISANHSGSSAGSGDENNDQLNGSSTKSPSDSQPPTKSESKPQATFLTKLYALLERPENHHMIRWDAAGEHIIVERPEQLALHVLPSIYRQSRFASFSRQLNIYGFMRKVNLRNVDPAIDDPDASTWSHPTLNRHSPPEVVANFKRRVPPRLPKPRKRDIQEPTTIIPPPRSANGIGLNSIPLTVPSSVVGMNHMGHMQYGSNGSVKNGMSMQGRPRGFSSPGSFTPLNQNGSSAGTGGGWGQSYSRSALPPLTVPSDPPMSHHSMYGHHSNHSLTPAEDSAPSGFGSYGGGRDMMGLGVGMSGNMSVGVNSSHYPYTESTWSFSPVSNGSSSSHSGSLSSLLNPTTGTHSNGSRPTPPTINTSYASNFSSLALHNNGDHHHDSASSLSPDTHSRPNTGYSMSSVSSLPYEDSAHHNGHGHTGQHHLSHDYSSSRPNSSHHHHSHHHRGQSPASRPPSSKSYSNSSSLRVGRPRRHSQAMSPYPSPYDDDHRPSTSPHPPGEDSANGSGGGMSRVRSMIQLPSVDPYTFTNSQAEFAYSVVPGNTASMESMDNGHGGWAGHHGVAARSIRPSTSASSISAASHTSSSQATTPPLGDSYGRGETDINRFSPDFGFVQMSEHLPQYTKVVGEI